MGMGGSHLVSLMEISVVKEFYHKPQTKDYLLKPSECETVINLSDTVPQIEKEWNFMRSKYKIYSTV